MKIEAGKQYRRRDGAIVEVYHKPKQDGAGRVRFSVGKSDDKLSRYHVFENGRRNLLDDMPSPLDLVEAVDVETDEITSSIPSVGAPSITVGMWRTRGGRPVEVVCVDAPGDRPIIGVFRDDSQGMYAPRWQSTGRWGDGDTYCPDLDLVRPFPRSKTRYACLFGYQDLHGTYTKMFARPGAVRSHLMESDRRVILSIQKVELVEGEFGVPAEDLR